MNKTAERRIELILPMLPDVEIAAVTAAGELARDLGMDDDSIDAMSHAIVEACINAFEHSHSSERKVELTFCLIGDREPDCLEIRVHDRGVGFAAAGRVLDRSIHLAAREVGDCAVADDQPYWQSNWSGA